MVIKIQHGPPSSKYFLIAQPQRKYDESRHEPNKEPFVEMTDPKGTHEKMEAVLIDTFTVHFKDFERMNALSLLAYGVPASELKTAMLSKYPELKETETIEYWLLKQI